MPLETQKFEKNQEVVAGKEAISEVLDKEITNPKEFINSVKEGINAMTKGGKKSKEKQELEKKQESKDSKEKQE